MAPVVSGCRRRTVVHGRAVVPHLQRIQKFLVEADNIVQDIYSVTSRVYGVVRRHAHLVVGAVDGQRVNLASNGTGEIDTGRMVRTESPEQCCVHLPAYEHREPVVVKGIIDSKPHCILR